MTEMPDKMSGPDLIAQGIPEGGAVIDLDGIETLLIANSFSTEDAKILMDFLSKLTDLFDDVPEHLDVDMQMGIAMETPHAVLCLALKIMDKRDQEDDQV